MEAAARYRHYAAECLRLARTTDNSAEKDLLVQMAEHWRELSDRAEAEDEEEEYRRSPRGS